MPATIRLLTNLLLVMSCLPVSQPFMQSTITRLSSTYLGDSNALGGWGRKGGFLRYSRALSNKWAMSDSRASDPRGDGQETEVQRLNRLRMSASEFHVLRPSSQETEIVAAEAVVVET
jgi:hypothetical protein